MMKMVNFWKAPGVMLIATAWTLSASPRWTCHHLCSLDLGVKLQVSGSESEKENFVKSKFREIKISWNQNFVKPKRFTERDFIQKVEKV